jgi:hypothetical protein
MWDHSVRYDAKYLSRFTKKTEIIIRNHAANGVVRRGLRRSFPRRRTREKSVGGFLELSRILLTVIRPIGESFRP